MSTILYTDSKRVSNSSVIDAFFYNRNSGDLIVQFNSGRRAGYADVPVHVADRIWRAGSAGQAYNWDIKGIYKGFSVDPNDTLSEVRETPTDLHRYIVPQTVPAAPVKHTFTITGTVPLTKEIEAETMEEAIEIFREGYDEAVVTSVNVKF